VQEYLLSPDAEYPSYATDLTTLNRDEHGPDPKPDRSRILTFFYQIGARLGFSAGPDRSRIVMSRDCQLKYAMP